MSTRWYLSPFVRDVTDITKPVRYCQINDQSGVIQKAGGVIFQDIEISGNHGLVFIAAPLDVHTTLASSFVPLPNLGLADKFGDVLNASDRTGLFDKLRMLTYSSEEITSRLRTVDLSTVRFGEYLNFMRTRRLKPRYDKATDSIILDGPAQPTNPLPIQAFAAFPTTSLLDNFNRPNEDPITGSWDQPVWNGDASAKIITNQAASNNAGGGWGGAWWTTTFANDQEVWATVPTFDSGAASNEQMGLFFRLADPGLTTMDGYVVHFGIDNIVRVNRVDNLVATQLGSDILHDSVDGDKIGAEMVGTTITPYYDSGFGWTALSTRTDSTYTAGFIGWELSKTGQRADDFSGGAIDRLFEAAAAFSFTTSADLTTEIIFAADASASLTVSASLETQIIFVSSQTFTLTGTADLTTLPLFEASASMSLVTTADLSTEIPLASSHTFPLTNTANLTTTISLAADLTYSLAITAAMTIPVGNVGFLTNETMASPTLTSETLTA